MTDTRVYAEDVFVGALMNPGVRVYAQEVLVAWTQASEQRVYATETLVAHSREDARRRRTRYEGLPPLPWGVKSA